jgi:O-acetyl-ADP-ribose deacetylase (regulator of RNase III)
MVVLATGNLLRAEVEALVNTVNTVGVMGKGVALQFKQAYPDNTKAYESACRKGQVLIGRMFVTYTGKLEPRLIINFPTKRHWRAASKLEDIQAGLVDLVQVIRNEKIKSIALPPLGCGLGGLRWEDVRPLIERAFETLPGVEVRLYAPGQAIAPEERIVNTPKPAMNAWRAALIMVVDAYRALGSDATHLEAQKLLYFLATAGEPVKTNFTKGRYGPYDEGMVYALKTMDGHYVVGFGDGDRLEPVRLKPGAYQEAEQFIRAESKSGEASERIDLVADLIDGFETPYGLELLATVHWVATREGADTLDKAIEQVAAWNDRKRRVMKPEHLAIAWKQLQDQGWMSRIVS